LYNKIAVRILMRPAGILYMPVFFAMNKNICEIFIVLIPTIVAIPSATKKAVVNIISIICQ